MMQAAESLLRKHPTRSYGTNPAVRCSLPESQMRAVVMIVVNIISEQPFQMALIHRDEVVQQISPTASDPALRYLPAKIDQKFAALAREWKTDSQFTSSPNQIFLLPSYQKIIALGPHAIPFILRDLDREPNHWFWALAALTGENPVRAEHAANVRAMRDAWLAWGRRQGHL
jgi:hypothetical protein